MSETDSKVEVNRREYNRYVATESIEDYALRYSPSSFRNWSEFLVANTALGSISFLALEAIGASIAINYGFENAFWGILAASIFIFLMGLPICYQAAKHNIDIDLLTRAAGFGYLGSTITSLIYASFCFIFFALEAAIMAQALLLYTGLPLYIGYAVSSIIIIPIVFYGMTMINKIQLITQPIWLVLMLLPFAFVLIKEPALIEQFFSLTGDKTNSSKFSILEFGFAIGISLSLIAQIGEQVDYLRFMPDKTEKNKTKWWFAVILAGPGWIILGFAKQIGGILLAALVLLGGASVIEAREPIHMYNAAYEYVFDNPTVALTVSFIFVILSQIKINVTNAYAGSLAWSNFFSRITHSHPGRVVWLVFNIVIALLLMELGVFDVLSSILGLYSNVAIAWISAIVADIVINKPCGFSPKIYEFKRAILFNVNPVGVFSTMIASIFSIVAYSGVLGVELQAFSSIVAFVTAFILSPVIAILTKGKYYIARDNVIYSDHKNHLCGVCGMSYDAKEMAVCPMYQTDICSLCCSLEARCHDQCKDKAEFSLRDKLVNRFEILTKNRFQSKSVSRLISFLLVFTILAILTAFLIWTTYSINALSIEASALATAKEIYINLFFILLLIWMVAAWLIVLMHESRQFVEKELVSRNDDLKLIENNLASAQKVAHVGSWEYDVETKKIIWSEECLRIFDADEDSYKNTLRGHIHAIHPEDKPFVVRVMDDAIENGKSYSIEHRIITKEGTLKYVSQRGEFRAGRNNQSGVYLGIVQDITELKMAEETIHHQAHFDELTDLPNRFLSLDRLAELLKDAERNANKVAVLFLDLDDFKKVNDSLGHDIGDQLLIESASRLKKMVRSKDTVGRLGGDEFLVLLSGLSSSEAVESIAENLISELRKSFFIDGRELIISASIGIAVYPDDGKDAKTLLKNSDSAMYHAKDIGRNTYSFYTKKMNNKVIRRLELEQYIHNAIEKNEFEVYYQPKIEVSSGKIIGAEALLRWHSKDLGEVSPVEFIPIAEQTGDIVPLGYFVLQQALNQTRYWQKNYMKDFQIAVNLSPRQFRDPNIVSKIQSVLHNTSVSSQYLELEITEGVLMSSHIFIDKALNQLSNLGINIAMDDFGTGYSSLSYLRTYPFNVLKIDRSFVRDISTDHADRELINAAIAMAHALNIKVVAEGVETNDQLDKLRTLGCDFAQGYLFSKPLPASEMELLLKSF